MDISQMLNAAYMPASDAYIAESKNQIEADLKKTDDLIEKLKNAQTVEDEDEIRKACIDFESYFIQMMLKEMRKTVVEDDKGLFKKSSAEKTFRDMFDEQVSINAANGGGIGIADFMFKQMKKENYGVKITDSLTSSIPIVSSE